MNLHPRINKFKEISGLIVFYLLIFPLFPFILAWSIWQEYQDYKQKLYKEHIDNN